VQSKPGNLREQKTLNFTAQDIRFPSCAKTLYAIPRGWPQSVAELVIKSVNTDCALLVKDSVANIALLGSDQRFSWRHNTEGLKITLPSLKPGNFAYTFKILLN
jgi:alpha-L-fucosidase